MNKCTLWSNIHIYDCFLVLAVLLEKELESLLRARKFRLIEMLDEAVKVGTNTIIRSLADTARHQRNKHDVAILCQNWPEGVQRENYQVMLKMCARVRGDGD